VSKRREVKARLSTLDEIDGIMVAMKNLALMETRRLATFLATQRRAVATIEGMAADFLSFYPPETSEHPRGPELFLLVGSERGFCGDFNEMVVAAWPQRMAKGGIVIAVGRRLEAKLRDDPRIAAFVDGSGVVEDVQPALLRLARTLDTLRDQHGATGLQVMYHDDDAGCIVARRLLPLPAAPARSQYSHSPVLNLEPQAFMSGLAEQYLYAALHEVFYSSLMAENRKRLAHMDSAIRRLEKDEAQLRLRYNALRQEEIIEEIEVIMLSAEALSDSVPG
jgi:F-type H+-transporting ATPase subunit gamma